MATKNLISTWPLLRDFRHDVQKDPQQVKRQHLKLSLSAYKTYVEQGQA